MTWNDRNSLRIRMTDSALDWTVNAPSTSVLTLVNAVSAKLPPASWHRKRWSAPVRHLR